MKAIWVFPSNITIFTPTSPKEVAFPYFYIVSHARLGYITWLGQGHHSIQRKIYSHVCQLQSFKWDLSTVNWAWLDAIFVEQHIKISGTCCTWKWWGLYLAPHIPGGLCQSPGDSPESTWSLVAFFLAGSTVKLVCLIHLDLTRTPGGLQMNHIESVSKSPCGFYLDSAQGQSTRSSGRGGTTLFN